MIRGCPGILLILIGLWTAPLPAATISFQILETGLGNREGLNDSSILWENSLMDLFFEGGHIVSNAPIRRLADSGPGSRATEPLTLPEALPSALLPEAQAGFEEARQGRADYFVLALLDFQGAGAAEKMPRPRNVRLRLFRVRSGELLAEQGCGEALSSRDEREKVNSTVQKLLAYLKR